jgi:hypothetical protein
MTVSCSKVLKDTHQYIFDLYLTVYYNSQRENLSNAVVNCNKYQNNFIPEPMQIITQYTESIAQQKLLCD